MKKFILATIILIGCSETPKEQPQPPKVHHEVAPLPEPVNPFAKPVVPVPQVHTEFQPPTFVETTQIKMNDDWSIFIWRDSPNNVTCYFYAVKNSTANGISCVKN